MNAHQRLAAAVPGSTSCAGAVRQRTRVQSALHRGALLPDRAAFRHLVDVVRRERHLARGVAHVDGDAPDEAIDAYAVANAGDTQNGTRSCRMGDPAGATTVVDPECRVFGIDGLRVADTSIMPYLVRANTHIPVIMIAEKIAATILS